MASKKIEDAHTELIKKLLKDSGLICDRSPPSSEVSEEEEAEGETGGEEEEATIEEGTYEGHEDVFPEETIAEEYTDVFPTPSLRRIIPERIRRIEAHNRIKVLPETFKTDINPDDIPKINYTASKIYIDMLANITGCKNYKSSLAEYWFLDTLANLLRRAQEDEFDKPTQAVLILWFCEWMKEMQQFDAANRERMLRRWKDNMINAAKVIAEENTIPTPAGAGVYYVAPSTSQETSDNYGQKRVYESNPHSYECSMRDLSKIIHYLYDLFSTDYQYDLVRSIFTFGPEYKLIDGPYQLERPKHLYAVVKGKKEGGKPKDKGGKDKGKDKGKKKEIENEEYLHLLKLMADVTKEQEEMEEKEQEEWNKKNSILPLGLSVDEEFYELYWPTPVEPPERLSATPPPPAKPAKGKK